MGELRGLEPEEKVDWLVVLIKESGVMGKLGTVRGVVESPSAAMPAAGGRAVKKGKEVVVAVVLEGGGSMDCCP